MESRQNEVFSVITMGLEGKAFILQMPALKVKENPATSAR